MSNKKNLKSIPQFKTDEEAEKFIDEADLSQYDLSGFNPVHFEFERKSSTVTLRFPPKLLATVKRKARAHGMPYQRFIRQVIEKGL